MRKATPFLMFTGKAEEAMRFYAATFPRSRIAAIDRYGADGPGVEGTVRRASLNRPRNCVRSRAPCPRAGGNDAHRPL